MWEPVGPDCLLSQHLPRVTEESYDNRIQDSVSAPLHCHAWMLAFVHDGAAMVFTLLTNIPFIQYCIIADELSVDQDHHIFKLKCICVYPYVCTNFTQKYG